MVFDVENGEKCFNGTLISLLGNQCNDKVILMLRNLPVQHLTDYKGATLLHHAAFYNNAVVAQYLIDRGCEVDATDTAGLTPLHNAVRSPIPGVTIIEVLLKNRAYVNARDNYGRTPLFLYPWTYGKNNFLGVLKIMLDHGASMTLLDDSGSSVLETLFAFGDKKILQLLLQYDVDFMARDGLDRTPLHFLAKNRNVNSVIKLMEGKTFDINARDRPGETALFNAVLYKYVNTVEFLLEHQADPNVMNIFGMTPLHTAVWTGLSEKAGKYEQKIVELLLHYGADAQSLVFDEARIVRLDFHLPLLQSVLAHLAMIESQRHVITEFTRTQIDSKVIHQEYFAKCQQQLELLKTFTVYESVTLYKLLTESPERIVHYAFNPGFALTFKGTVRKVFGYVNSYYYHILRRRVSKAIQIAEMKLKAAAVVQQLTGFHVTSHRTIVTKIVNYLNDQDLKNLVCQEQKIFLSLNSLFSTEE